jgi:hypothetical protein
MARLLDCVSLFLNRYSHADCIANKNRLDKSQAIISIRHGAWIDYARSKPDSYAEDERAVSDSSAEWLSATPLLVHVVRVEVAGLTGMQYDICFRYRTTGRTSVLSHNIFFKMYSPCHFRSERCPQMLPSLFLVMKNIFW